MEQWKLEPARDLGMPLDERARSLRRESGLLSTFARSIRWGVVRGYLRVYHRLEIIGREHLPKEPPFVLIANHASHLDALVLSAALPWRTLDRVYPLAAGDVFFEKPARAVLAASVLNAFPVWRGKAGAHALEEMRTRLIEEPCIYILFPEGTRSRDGAMAEFKGGLGRLTAAAEVPVVPCHLAGTFVALPPNCRVPRPRKVTLRVGEPVVFSDVANDGPGWKHISRTCETAVRRLGGEPIGERPDDR
jgi:1-acyl-sn-glycerol-3-phosphate acyltransferase